MKIATEKELKLNDLNSFFNESEAGKYLLDVMLESAYLLGCAGKKDDAEKCFRGILALLPELIGGWLGLGNILLMQGKIKQSESAYKRVLKNDSSDPAARAFLGELYLCTDKISEGRALLESVYWDYPESKVGNWAWNLLELSREIAR